MDTHIEVKEYDVLGQNIRLKDSGDNDNISPDEVVSLVLSEAEKLKQGAPNLADSQAAILVALKIAQDKLELEKEYRVNIGDLNEKAKNALELVEQIVPMTH